MLLKKLNKATGVETSNLAVKTDFIALKAEFEKLDITKFVNVTIGSKVDDLDVGKSKTLPINLKVMK